MKVKATRQVKQNLINIEMDRPTRMKFLPKKLCDNEKDSKETFQCSYCNSNYARKASLNTHIKQKHQEDEPISREAPISSSTEATKPSEAFLQTISSGMI